MFCSKLTTFSAFCSSKAYPTYHKRSRNSPSRHAAQHGILIVHVTVAGNFPNPLYLPGPAARGSALFTVDGQHKGVVGGRGSALTQAVSVLSGTEDQTAPVRRFCTDVNVDFGQTLRLEERSGECKARDIHWLAQASIPSILVLEIARRKATVAERHTAIDCRDGSQQSNLGTGAGSGRTLAQAGNPGITANGEELLASRSGYRTAESLNPALDDLCAKPCKLCSRL